MSESSDSPAHQALASLTLVVDELTEAVEQANHATLTDDQLHRTERSISMGIAMLVGTRDAAAAALEASVAGAAPREEPALARDLLMIAAALHQALRQAIASAGNGRA